MLVHYIAHNDYLGANYSNNNPISNEWVHTFPGDNVVNQTKLLTSYILLYGESLVLRLYGIRDLSDTMDQTMSQCSTLWMTS